MYLPFSGAKADPHTTAPSDPAAPGAQPRPVFDALSASSPYRVRLVNSADDLDAVVAVRREAYGARLQALADQVGLPEAFDYSHGAVILLLERSDTAEPFGTIRLNTGHGLLQVMSDMALPAFITDNEIGYVSRMAITGPARQRPLIRALLDKAIFQLCAAKQIRNMLIFAVVPRERMFMTRGFRDIFDDGLPRHPQFLNRVPIRALSLDVVTLERDWRASNHPLYSFFFEQYHAEIEIFASVTSIVRRVEQRDRATDTQPRRPGGAATPNPGVPIATDSTAVG